MGLFSQLGHSLDSMATPQGAQMPPPATHAPAPPMAAFAGLNFGFLPSGKADAQHEKDLKRLESALVQACVPHCQRKERNFHSDSELCLAKCYDTSYYYARVGLNELNQFAYEHKLGSS